MAMLVMGIRNVRMAVCQGIMLVPVRMWLSRRVVGSMLVSMMRIVAVSMRMHLNLVTVFVLMMLGDV
jgi:hypothetical protein